MNTASHRAQWGATLVEVSLAVAIAAVTVGAGAAAMSPLAQRRHLAGAAAQLETDVHYARSLAAARNQSLRITFPSDAAAACYVIHTGAANACGCGPSGQAVCTGGATALRTVSFAANAPVTVQSNSRSMLLDAANATVTPTATVQVRARNGETLKVIVNIMGRVRTCSASAALQGYTAC